MPLFSNSQNFVLNNSPLTDITINNSAGPTGIDMLFEASVLEAAHDSSARYPPPRCFPGTREQYVEDITNWSLPAVGDIPLPIYWMKGPAGVGKSAVAQTCAEKLKRRRKLGAAFFFSINRWSKNDNALFTSKKEHYKFFTSIAYQLSTAYPNYRDLLDAKIRRDRSLVDKTMESQFWELIVEPLQELKEKGLGIGDRIPVLVDGLDECESREAQREIIEIVAAAARDDATPLCWAFFSRVEPHIEATFSKSGVSSLCQKAVLPVSHDADGDIELYLKAGFEDIIQRLNVIMDVPWPSDSDMEQLVRAANGLFIYAKTVLRFVGQPDSLDPEELLRTIMTVVSNRSHCDIIPESIFADLDRFYMLIMQRVPAKALPTIDRIFAFLCQSPFSSAIVIANFLGLSRVQLEAACNQMGAVVHFQHPHEPLEFDPVVDTSQSFLHTNPHLLVGPRPIVSRSLGGSISFYHKSFSDFLLDPLRSGTYCINPTTRRTEKQWRDRVLQRENFYCWRGLELVRDPGAPPSASTLSYPCANELTSSLVEATIDFLITGRDTWLDPDFDFRKQLYITTTLMQTMLMGPDTLNVTLYNCASFSRCIHKTVVQWLQPGEFPKFDLIGFKEHVEERQQRNVMRPYHLIPPSLDKPQGRVESGLYVIGHGLKSIFWYWEIDYDSMTYRTFGAVDLVEGERIYQEHFSSTVDDRMFK